MATAHPDLDERDAYQRIEELRAQIEPTLERLRTEQGLERAFVVLINPATSVIRDVFGMGFSSALLDAFGMPPQAPELFLDVLRQGKAFAVSDASSDARLGAKARRSYVEARVNSFVVVPLLPSSAVLVAGRSTPLRDEESWGLFGVVGQLVALLWEHVRVSERNAASNHAVLERDWLRSMLNAVPDPVLLSDERNNILYQNAHAQRLFEVTAEDSPGRQRAVELNNFLLSTALSSFVLDQGASLGREFTAVDPVEGSELLFEVICQTVEDPSTGEHHLVSVLRNVTDLHGAIEELRISLRELEQVNTDLRYERDRLNLVLENVADPIVVTGAANEMIMLNSSAKQLLQASDQPHVGGKQPTAYYANDAKLGAFLLDLQLSQDQIRRGEIQLMDPATDDELAMSITATKVMNPLGQLAATVSVLHDLTQVRELERRRLEYQLFESEKLAALGRLAAAVAHEINNPLESIKNSLYLVQADVPAATEGHRFLDIATKETDRVSRIIRQMLGFYRGGTAKAPVNVNATIEEAAVLLQRQFTARRIRLHMDLGKGLSEVTASADQLKQVFLNLFLNAVDVMEDGGDLWVTTRKPGQREDVLSGEQVIIEVRDTGSGIAPDHLEHIFDPFFSTKRDRGGTGLGLWVCHDIVKDHGGQLKVRSRLGEGTTFLIALPVKRQDE